MPVIERMSQTLKARVRAQVTSLPFVMPALLLEYCVYFCARCVNLQPSADSRDAVSPEEQFSGLKLDAKRDLKCGFGDFVHATEAETDNSMNARTTGCVALLPTGNPTGSVQMWSLSTRKVITRDQFRVVPMPDVVCEYITGLARKQGYTLRDDPILGEAVLPADSEDSEDNEPVPLETLPTMQPIDGRADRQIDSDDAAAARDNHEAAAAGVNRAEESSAAPGATDDIRYVGQRRSTRIAEREASLLTHAKTADRHRAELRRQLLLREKWKDCEFAFKMSVRGATPRPAPPKKYLAYATLPFIRTIRNAGLFSFPPPCSFRYCRICT